MRGGCFLFTKAETSCNVPSSPWHQRRYISARYANITCVPGTAGVRACLCVEVFVCVKGKERRGAGTRGREIEIKKDR